MNETTVSVRAPIGLVKEVDRLVGEGIYKNRTDMIVHSMRKNVEEHRQEHPETLKLRKAKEGIMQDYIRKAKGDRNKAIDMLFDDVEKNY